MVDYASSGVNVSDADAGISKIVEQIKQTWSPINAFGSVKLDIGYFANVIDIGGGTGLAMCTDGVGSKTIICDMMGKYDTIGIDCVAMNANDLICVGARPLSMTDYIAVEKADPEMLGQIGIGLKEGALQAGLSISGGEVSQLRDIVHGFDLVGSAVGIVSLDRINVGAAVEPGDAIIGLASNGIHSNGLTLARQVLLSHLEPTDRLPELQGRSIGEELLRPTRIYVREILSLAGSPAHALINITGDGLLNLNRIARRDVGFLLDALPTPPPIFTAIQEIGGLSDQIMYETFNMGIGFCIIVPPHYASLVQSLPFGTSVIGHVIADGGNEIQIPSLDLIGRGKSFVKVAA